MSEIPARDWREPTPSGELEKSSSGLRTDLPPEPSEAAQRFVEMALISSALSVAAKDLEAANKSTVFDISTDTGRERLKELLEEIGWARGKAGADLDTLATRIVTIFYGPHSLFADAAKFSEAESDVREALRTALQGEGRGEP